MDEVLVKNTVTEVVVRDVVHTVKASLSLSSTSSTFSATLLVSSRLPLRSPSVTFGTSSLGKESALRLVGRNGRQVKETRPF